MRRKYLEDLERDVEFRLESMKDLVLTTVVESALVSSFYMKKPGDRFMSTLLTFTPEGIVIQGDHKPEAHGACSCGGYGLLWFIEDLAPDDLCEKFLAETFVFEYAVSFLKEYVLNAVRAGRITHDDARRAWDEANAVVIEEEEALYDIWSSVFGYGNSPCWRTYPPYAMVSLVAIQRKFRELYRARTWQPS